MQDNRMIFVMYFIASNKFMSAASHISEYDLRIGKSNMERLCDSEVQFGWVAPLRGCMACLTTELRSSSKLIRND